MADATYRKLGGGQSRGPEFGFVFPDEGLCAAGSCLRMQAGEATQLRRSV